MQKLINYLLLVFLFFLPWQTRYVWHWGELNGGPWEYGTFSIYATEILLWIVLILFFASNFFKKEFLEKLKEKRQPIFLILFLFFIFLSAAFSDNFWISYNYVFRILEGMALMAVLGWEKEKIKYQAALWAGAVAQGALAVWQFLTQNVWSSKWLGMAGQDAGNLGPSVIEFADQRWLRAYGAFGSPNSLGIYLAVLFVLGLVLYLKIESRKKKIILSVGQIFVLSGLLVSFSRGAWLAAAVGAASLLLVLIKNCHPERALKSDEEFLSEVRTDRDSSRSFRMTFEKDFAKQIVFSLIVIIFWLIIFYPVFTARFNLNNRLEAKSISERKDQYAEALYFIKSNPVLGAGPGAFTYALYKKYPTLPVWEHQPIHNIYLLALVEIGIAGFLFLFLFFKRLFWLIVKNNLIYTPVLVTLVLAGVLDHWLWSMYTGVIFWWVIYGLASASNLSSLVSDHKY